MRKPKSGENILKLHVAKMIKKQSMQRVRNTQPWMTNTALKREWAEHLYRNLMTLM